MSQPSLLFGSASGTSVPVRSGLCTQSYAIDRSAAALPAMFAGLLARGFAWQRLAPERVEARPHEGSLFYERMFRTPYAAVRAALDAALPRIDVAQPRSPCPARGD